MQHFKATVRRRLSHGQAQLCRLPVEGLSVRQGDPLAVGWRPESVFPVDKEWANPGDSARRKAAAHLQHGTTTQEEDSTAETYGAAARRRDRKQDDHHRSLGSTQGQQGVPDRRVRRVRKQSQVVLQPGRSERLPVRLAGYDRSRSGCRQLEQSHHPAQQGTSDGAYACGTSGQQPVPPMLHGAGRAAVCR